MEEHPSDSEVSGKFNNFWEAHKGDPCEGRYSLTSMCTECGIWLSILTDVKRHIREVHPRVVTYSCRHCEKGFFIRVPERTHKGD